MTRRESPPRSSSSSSSSSCTPCTPCAVPYCKRNGFMLLMYALFGVNTLLKDVPTTELVADSMFVGVMVVALVHALYTGRQSPVQFTATMVGVVRVIIRDVSLAMCPTASELGLVPCTVNMTDPMTRFAVTSSFKANGLKTFLVALNISIFNVSYRVMAIALVCCVTSSCAVTAIHLTWGEMLSIQTITILGGVAWVYDVYVKERMRKTNQIQVETHIKQTEAWTGDYSHNMKTPLLSIQFATQALRALHVPPEAEKLFRVIDRSLDYMTCIMSSVMNGLGGVTAVKIEEVRVRHTVQHAVSIVQDAKAAAKTIIFELNVPNLVVYADRRKIVQNLVNFLSNAVKYGKNMDGQTIVRVTVRVDEAHLVFRVEDNGPGIREEILPDLFQHVVRHSTKGNGLGTAAVGRATKSMGGTVGAENKKEGGACFWFTVPYHPKKDRISSSGGGMAEKKSSDSVVVEMLPVLDKKTNEKKILFAEDNDFNREFIATMLSNAGFDVVSVTDGEQACDEYQKNTFDLCLFDLHMDGSDDDYKNGDKAAQKIKELDDDSPPIIMISTDIPKKGELPGGFDAAISKQHLNKKVLLDILQTCEGENNYKSVLGW